jgi:hypothetical protein
MKGFFIKMIYYSLIVLPFFITIILFKRLPVLRSANY